MLTAETIEKLKISKIDYEAEACSAGEGEAIILVGDSSDYDLLSSLHSIAIEWKKSLQIYMKELDEYIPLEFQPPELNECMLDGFCSKVIQKYEELKAAARNNGECQAKARIENEPDYQSLCCLHEEAIEWKNSPVDFNYENNFSNINYDELHPLWLNRCVIEGFYAVIIQMYDEFDLALA